MASGKQPSRDARQHGEKCQVLFSRPNKPRHRHGTVLQGGNAGNSILSFRNAILTFSFQSYHLAAQSCHLVRHPIIRFLHSIPIICNPILFVTPPNFPLAVCLHRRPVPSVMPSILIFLPLRDAYSFRLALPYSRRSLDEVKYPYVKHSWRNHRARYIQSL